MAELYSLLSREPEFSQIFLDYYQYQAEHHRRMLGLLEEWLPQIQSTQSKWLFLASLDIFGGTFSYFIPSYNAFILSTKWLIVRDDILCYLVQFSCSDSMTYSVCFVVQPVKSHGILNNAYFVSLIGKKWISIDLLWALRLLKMPSTSLIIITTNAFASAFIFRKKYFHRWLNEYWILIAFSFALSFKFS